MYDERVDGGKVCVQLACDRKKCSELATVWDFNHTDAQKQLYDKGWRLYRGKQLCPTHARVVARRLARI
jgi:hypothetical protein